MGKYDELFERVKTMAKAVDEKIFELIPEKEPRNLYDAARHYPLAGGKRVRPFVVIRATEAVGGDLRKALYPAAAVEFIHNYSLVHDDIMDMDELRRGRPQSTGSGASTWRFSPGICSSARPSRR